MIAGHAAVETIDGMLTALRKIRAVLVSGIGHDQDKVEARADAIFASCA